MTQIKYDQVKFSIKVLKGNTRILVSNRKPYSVDNILNPILHCQGLNTNTPHSTDEPAGKTTSNLSKTYMVDIHF